MHGRLAKISVLVVFAGAAILTACQGSPAPSLVPLDGANDPLWSTASKSSPISSTCGTGISIDYPGTAKCSFAEQGYSGSFTIDDSALKKAALATVTPTKGTAKTAFRIDAGKDSGFGAFTVSDANGHSLDVWVGQLKTDEQVTCVHAKTAAQSVALPQTGGISATVDFGKYASKTKSCDDVTIATGADATKVHGAQDLLIDLPETVAAHGGPLLTITAGEGFDADPLFGQASIVSNVQLKTSSDLRFPDGKYYATITRTDGTVSQLNGHFFLIAKNGVLRVGSQDTGTGKLFPFFIQADKAAIISVYPRGTNVEATPTPSPFPSPTGTIGSFPTSSPIPHAWGKPPPAPGAVFGNSEYNWPKPPCPGAPYPCNQQQQMVAGYTSQNPQAPLGFSGSLVWNADLSYMGLHLVKMDCPREWTVSADSSGSGSIFIPRSDYYGKNASLETCVIVWSTIPPGKHGEGYSWYEEICAYGGQCPFYDVKRRRKPYASQLRTMLR